MIEITTAPAAKCGSRFYSNPPILVPETPPQTPPLSPPPLSPPLQFSPPRGTTPEPNITGPTTEQQTTITLKKLERMRRNRISAANSRLRKSQYISSLENEVRALKVQNQYLTSLESEVRALKVQVSALTAQSLTYQSQSLTYQNQIKDLVRINDVFSRRLKMDDATVSSEEMTAATE